MPDREQSNCKSCDATFTVFRRKHHCRNCGFIFCVKCAGVFQPVPKWGYACAVRVCNGCASAGADAENVKESANVAKSDGAAKKKRSFVEAIGSPRSDASKKPRTPRAAEAAQRPPIPSFLSAIKSPDARNRLKKAPAVGEGAPFSPRNAVGGNGSSLLDDLRSSMKKRRRDIEGEGEKLASRIEESITSARKTKKMDEKMSRVNSITPRWGSIAKMMSMEEGEGAAEREEGGVNAEAQSSDDADAEGEFSV